MKISPQTERLLEACKKSLSTFARIFFGSSPSSPRPVDPSKFSPQELRVWDAISKNAKPRVTQFALVHGLHMISPHPDGDVVKATNSAMRKLRQTVHDLRKNHYAPIASDEDGYYVPKNELEAVEFLNREKRRIRSSIISLRVIFKAFEITYGMRDSEFEKQSQLFPEND